MNHATPLTRRSFLQSLALASLATRFPACAEPAARRGIKLGMDNFAVRGMGWKAKELIDYAAGLKLDTLLISDLEAYESLENDYLRGVKKQADERGIELYAGSWSICPTSVKFKKNWGSAEEHLRLGLRVAKTLGSPVFRVVLGAAEDRQTPGGIRARIADTVQVLKNCRQDALDAGVKVAVENHAGDMHSWELRDLVEAAGPDFVGVNIDSGNAAWTLEDPLDVLRALGKYTICSSLRDDMIWETEDGAAVQWTAAGEGLIDWAKYADEWQKLCPKVPVMIETISGFSRAFPYKKEGFWKNYDQRPEALAAFEALAKRGHKLEGFKAPDGVDRKKAEQDFQKGDLERSIAYLREKIGLGLKAA